ncbi:heterokaryon incompatibility protein-domain-containing protein [Cubamyces lactineus]|nr:heterokaryon incompatibility protein-domain-containing protein [Cubamyces lactineus]
MLAPQYFLCPSCRHDTASAQYELPKTLTTYTFPVLGQYGGFGCTGCRSPTTMRSLSMSHTTSRLDGDWPDGSSHIRSGTHPNIHVRRKVTGRVRPLVSRTGLKIPLKGLLAWDQYIAIDSTRSSLSNRVRMAGVGSARALSVAERCIGQCSHGHPSCRQFTLHPLGSAPLPTRLIDCSNPFRPRIIEMAPNANGVYVALSYVWGGLQPHRTCRANLASYMDGIDTTSLPQTIRDAIYVTHALGFRFLWIDSLCIVQDWREDLQRELGRMRHIYRHAFLTIDAASADNVNHGFLHDTAPPSPTQPGVQSNIPDPGTRSRAWCLQETLMSCRSIVFTASAVQFWCRTTAKNGGDAHPLKPEGLLLWEDRPFLPDIVMEPFPKPRYSPGELSAVYHAWRRMLSYYTDRVLSRSSDKLVACAGLAEDFGRLLSSEYLAGLWRNFLLYDLLWQVSYESPGHITPCRPSPYRAPSWSWASVDGYILWGRDHLSDAVATEPLAQIVGCSVIPQDKTLPFGRVTSGSLVLRAPMLSCKRNGKDHGYVLLQGLNNDRESELAQNQRVAVGAAQDTTPGFPASTQLLQIQPYPDCEEDSAIRDVWAIPLVRLPGKSCAEGLLVTWAGLDDEGGATQRSVYRRVAYFAYQSDNLSIQGWFSKGSHPSVEIELV